MIKGIRPGLYNLFAWVPGVIGDYKYGPSVKVASGFNFLNPFMTKYFRRLEQINDSVGQLGNLS